MKTIKINNKDMHIRRVKVREVKVLIKELAGKVKDVFSFMDNASNEENLEETATSIIIENIDYVGELVTKFTENLSMEEFDELDVIDLIDLLKEILEYNGIKGALIKDFFQNYNGAVKTQVQESFTKKVPMAQANVLS